MNGDFLLNRDMIYPYWAKAWFIDKDMLLNIHTRNWYRKMNTRNLEDLYMLFVWYDIDKENIL